MSAFDPDQYVWILLEHRRRGTAIHIVVVVFVKRAAHARTDDVQKGEHTRVGTVDHPLLEVLKIAPSGAACINDGSHSFPEGKAIRVEAIVPRVGSPLSRSGVRMHVDVD